MDLFYGVFIDNPDNRLPSLIEEKKRIDNILSPLRAAGKLHYDIDENISISQIIDRLRTYQEALTIFHYSGHHTEDYLDIYNQQGIVADLSDIDLIRFLRQCPRLRMVFINGCATQNILENLTDVPIKIGSTCNVYDFYAKEYAIQYYSTYFNHWDANRDIDQEINSVRNAYENQTIALDILSLSEEAIEELRIVRGSASHEDFLRSAYILLPRETDLDLLSAKMIQSFQKDRIQIKEILQKLSKEIDDVGNIYSQYPYNLSIILQKLLVDKWEEFGFSKKRFLSTRELFKRYLQFIRVIFLSILHDTIDSLDHDSRSKMSRMIKTKFDNNLSKLHSGIEELFEIVDNIDYRSRYPDINDLIEEFNGNKEFIRQWTIYLSKSLSGTGSDLDNYLIDKSIIGLGEFIRRFKDIRQYSFGSLSSFSFQNYRRELVSELTFTISTYPVGSRPSNSKAMYPPTSTNLSKNFQLKDQNSVYLLKRPISNESKITYVLNLTPYIIDFRNEEFNKMELKFLDMINGQDGYYQPFYDMDDPIYLGEWIKNLEQSNSLGQRKFIQDDLRSLIQKLESHE